MRRTGGFVFLVRHHDRDWDHIKLFKSDLFNTVQKAINDGCGKEDVVSELESMREAVAWGFVLPRGKGNDSVAKHGLQDVEPISMMEAVACGSVLPRGEGDDSVEKGGGGIDNAMYTEDLGNLSNAGRNLQGEDRE